MRSTKRFRPLDISIAGAGLVGRLLGWQLCQRGHTVVLFERSSEEQPESAAWVAAALLGPVSERPDCPKEIWDLAIESMSIWPEWLDELKVPFGMDGSIVLAHGSDGAQLRKFTRSLETLKVKGVIELQRDGIARLEPDLPHHFQSGLFLEDEGWLDNRVLLNTLARCCGTIRFNEEVHPDDLVGDLVIDCRGVGADDPEIRGVRGEVIRVRAPEVFLSRPIRLMHPKYHIYVSPRPNDEYIIGATQIESESRKLTTVRSALELLSAAFTVHSGFAEAEIIEMSVGLRPAFPDNRPRIRRRGRVLQINGLFRHGYLVAPALVTQALHEIEEECKSPLMAKA